MRRHNLSLAPEMTESVIIRGQKKIYDVLFKVGNKIVAPIQVVKYLVVWIDDRLIVNEYF